MRTGGKKASRNRGWEKSEGGVTERTRVRAQGYSESLSGLECERCESERESEDV